MNEGDKDNPGVIAIPPLIYLVPLLIGLALDYFWPVALLPDRAQYMVGFLLIAASIVLIALTVPLFRRAGTPFKVRKPATALVTSGVFRFSRNPGYLALTVLYIGISIAADTVWMLVLLAPALVVVNYGAILREERYLERKFGEEYLRYKAVVRRWL